jgi:hypothetical protein
MHNFQKIQRSRCTRVVRAALLAIAILHEPARMLFAAKDSGIHQKTESRQAILAAMQEVMGTLPGSSKRCELAPIIEASVDCGEYIRKRLTYQSEPGGRVPAYLLIPKSILKSGEKAPGILCLHPTDPLGNKVVAGLGNSPNDAYAVELAARGFVCLAPSYPLLADYSPDLRALGYSSGSMKAIWDNIRGLDYLESLPFVQKEKFGAIGHSLGGHNALFTAAFDERIKAVVTSCGFDSFSDYMNGDIKGWTSERYMPRLLNYSSANRPFDFDDVLRAIAPRQVFVSAPTGDANFKWKSVDQMAASARPEFEREKGTLHVEHPECGHLFPKETREQAYQFIDHAIR